MDQVKEKPVSVSSDEICKEQPYVLMSLLMVNLISPAWYFNESLLNFNHYFASNTDYIFFSRSVYEQHPLRPSMNFAMLKIKLGTLTAGTVKSCFKRKIESFVVRDNAFSFMSSVKGALAYWK